MIAGRCRHHRPFYIIISRRCRFFPVLRSNGHGIIITIITTIVPNDYHVGAQDVPVPFRQEGPLLVYLSSSHVMQNRYDATCRLL